MEDRKRALARFPLFEGLSERELAEVDRIARSRKLQAGDPLFHKGDEGLEFCLVVRGRLKAYVTSADGQDRIFRQMAAGDVVGEIAMFAGGKRTANVTALDDCELIVIQRSELNPLLRRCPEIAIRLLGVLAGRTIELSEALADANFRPVGERLAKSLLRFADRWGVADERGHIHIGVRLSQGELGEIIGATRESVNKSMGQWTERGIVEVHDRNISILDRPALVARSERQDGLDGKARPTASRRAARSPAGTSAKPNPGKARPAARRRSDRA